MQNSMLALFFFGGVTLGLNSMASEKTVVCSLDNGAESLRWEPAPTNNPLDFPELTYLLSGQIHNPINGGTSFDDSKFYEVLPKNQDYRIKPFHMGCHSKISPDGWRFHCTPMDQPLAFIGVNDGKEYLLNEKTEYEGSNVNILISPSHSSLSFGQAVDGYGMLRRSFYSTQQQVNFCKIAPEQE